MGELLKKWKANYTLSALLCTIAGIVLVIWPGESTQVVCRLLGGILLLYGVFQIVVYLVTKERTMYHQGAFMLGIVLSVLGFWILLNPDSVIAAIPVIVGILIMIHGLHNTVQAFDLKKMRDGHWGVAAVLGLLTVILGLILIINPFGVIRTVVRVLGAFLIYDGLSDVWILSRVSKAKKTIIDVDAKTIDE